MWLSSPLLSCRHGFSDRHGGVSPQPFATLNLGGHEDTSQNIGQNRQIALNALGIEMKNLCLVKQVHGCDVRAAEAGSRPEGDALVTNQKGLALAVSVADCYPLLFHDELNGVIAATHAGWRGTCAGITAGTILKMEQLGARRKNIKVAIGQGISAEKFEVGKEVTEKFRSAGFPEEYLRDNKIDLLGCLLYSLSEAGIEKQNTWAMKRCSTENDFFSYRRDKGNTGRMWGVISMV